MGELSQIIKLDATDSTNLYLKSLAMSNALKDYTTVVTKVQKKGRGQMGTVWKSEAGKNLTFSVLKHFNTLNVDHQFHLNIAVSLALHTVLTDLNIPNVKVKWPNDIMSGSKKICGILIENVLNGSLVKKSVIGIGLNVNQASFNNLDKASSLSLLSGRTFDLDYVLKLILEKIKAFLDTLEQISAFDMKTNYESLLFRKDQVSTFKKQDGELVPGIIRGVSEEGKLIVELEDEIFTQYSFKEVSLQF
ncbi:biotin--[acetyl-CoA-carboxylase] ligase [Flagellimonas sp. S174]|uniref:biotin--[acetyl-CoA-carboxylase] ligase n=1 Tax=Flagellimonas sp. S174 TaxID=3410790 RepID=UPI003BF5F35D